MRKTNAIKARKARARNFGGEAVLVRSMDCIVHTAARDSGLDMNGEELDALGWTPCGGAACAHHVHPRQRGGVGEGRMGLFPGCARHGEEAGEASPIHGPSSKRRKFESLYSVDVVRIADAIALAHPRPLGILGLTDRWVWWQVHEHLGSVVELEALDGYLERLVGYDLAALLSWVRRRMAAYVKGCADIDRAWSSDDENDRDDMVTEWMSLDLEIDADALYALCALAGGWPS